MDGRRERKAIGVGKEMHTHKKRQQASKSLKRKAKSQESKDASRLIIFEEEVRESTASKETQKTKRRSGKKWKSVQSHMHRNKREREGRRVV